MATNLKEVNYSGEKLTVGAIEILGDMTGGGVKTIQRSISDLAETVQTVAAETSDYWTAIASDLIITPTEKKQIKKEWNTIAQSYTTIYNEAQELGILDYAALKSYIAAYEALYTYLFTTIRLFDNLSENTTIPSAENFNKVFADYYSAELEANQQIAVGQVDVDSGIRTISNLSVVGYDGEVAIYKGSFYQYSTAENKWTQLNTGTLYLGAFNYQPAGELNKFFLCYEETPYKARLVTSSGVLKTGDGKYILANLDSFEAGYIYYYGEGGLWVKVENKNDWRYIVAMNDLIKYGFQVSEYIEQYIEENSHTAQYLGALDTFPSEGEYKSGDWFMWAGATQSSSQVPEGTIYYGQLYKFNDPTWTRLEPGETYTVDGRKYLSNATEYMAALNDILTAEQATEGYFSTVFANAFFANNAVLGTLQVQTIELKDDGCIKSDGYTWNSGQKGFILNSDGTLQISDGDFTGTVGATVFHFSQTFTSSDTGYYDAAGEFHEFANNDMWLVGD